MMLPVLPVGLGRVAIAVVLVSSFLPSLLFVTGQEFPNPEFQIEAFTYPTNVDGGGTFRNDFCDLNDRRDELGGLSRVLEGVTLHPLLSIGEFTNMDAIFDSETNKTRLALNENFPGLVPLLLDEICFRAGCTWRDTYAIFSYDSFNSGDFGFDDLLTWGTEVYDVSLDWWMRSRERLRMGATFAEPWYDSTIIMVAPQVNHDETFNFTSWAKPFHNHVWYTILATILVSSAIYWIMEFLNPKTDRTKSQLDAIETTYMVATAFAGQFEFVPETVPAKLFTFSVAFWAMLIGAAYTANLASFLVVKNQPKFQIETLEQAVRADIPMCVWESTATDKSVSARFPAYASSGLLTRTNQRGVYEGLLDGTCQIAITEVSTWESFQYDIVNSDCSLQRVGRAFEFAPASFAIKSDAGQRCTSLLRAVFDVHLHDMEQEGKIEALWDKHTEQTAKIFCTGSSGAASSSVETQENRRERRLQDGHFRHLKAAKKDSGSSGGGTGQEGGDGFNDTTQLTLDNMGGVFLLHAILSTIAILSALVSWHWERSSKDPKKSVLFTMEDISVSLGKLRRSDTESTRTTLSQEKGKELKPEPKPEQGNVPTLSKEIMQRLALMEEEKARADKRLQEEFRLRQENEETYYREKRNLLEQAIGQMQQEQSAISISYA